MNTKYELHRITNYLYCARRFKLSQKLVKKLQEVVKCKTVFNRHNFVSLRDPVSQGTQCSAVQAEHDVNTIRVEYSNTAINHTEGGWPKDINIHDEEQTKRHRRKVEKDDNYNPVVMGLCRVRVIVQLFLARLY